jgi:transposase
LPIAPAMAELQEVLDARVTMLEAALAAERAARLSVEQERDRLRASHERLRLELELLKRRLFVAKAERVDTTQLEMEFADTLRKLDALGGLVPAGAETHDTTTVTPDSPGDVPAKPKASPSGRRDLKKLPLEEVRIELPDPVFEDLVARGLAERIGCEESSTLLYQRGGLRRCVTARVKYQVKGPGGETTVETTAMPPRTFPRSLAAPSLLAHVISALRALSSGSKVAR